MDRQRIMDVGRFDETQVHEVQFDAVRAKLLLVTRDNTADVVDKIRTFFSPSRWEGVRVDSDIITSLQSIHIVCNYEMWREKPSEIDEAKANAEDKSSCANALMTFPGGRSIVMNAIAFAAQVMAAQVVRAIVRRFSAFPAAVVHMAGQSRSFGVG